MHVRKFEAETLDQALQDIKAKLGPDAIILKTVTNKGIKGAFKKNRIEITAAISEKNYLKKSNVEKSLSSEQKDKFYQNNSSYISNMIDNYSENREVSAQVTTPSSGYGKMGINRPVSSIANKNVSSYSQVKGGLDDFLTTPESRKESSTSFDDFLSASNPTEELIETRPTQETMKEEGLSSLKEEMSFVETNVNQVSSREVELQKIKIDDLEKKIYELSKNFEKFDRKEATGLYQLRNTLKSLDISEVYIRNILKKAMFELSEDETENVDIVYEFALREMLGEIDTAMPLMSSNTEEGKPVVTVMVSESSCGQSSMAAKIGALKEDTVIVRMSNSQETSRDFTEKLFNLNIVEVSSIAEIVSQCRKMVEQGKSVIVDYKNLNTELNEVKKFVDGMRRSFDNVEVLISLSAIHSEVYNKKVIAQYGVMANGIVVSNLDLCLNFGALFNISIETDNLPYKFFGTGEIIPDDIESATAERILAGIFKLS